MQGLIRHLINYVIAVRLASRHVDPHIWEASQNAKRLPPGAGTPNDSLTTTDCKESTMAILHYSADSAPLPHPSLAFQVRSHLTDIGSALTANPAALATDVTCPITQLSDG
ncbi:hypothetical protein ABH994_001362 [Bradyrhizobium yuanmingense]|uniref:hypothetical protein n=1 Tax=Bradyrhizobium yuanmingense TaxID=108015 RepID=UPI0012FE4D3E|nr:hypothetical protein [Bradyrhizobium yuanmingense]